MTNYRFVLNALSGILLSATFLISCSDDDPVKDTQNPSITIVSPTSSDLLKGTVSVKVEIDELNLKNVQVYVGQTLLGESETSVVELTWDTKTVADGAHTIKVVATDKENNKAESTLQVDVLNTLLTFSVPGGFISADRDIWFFITSNEGLLLGVKKAQNGKDMIFETPDAYKKGESFILNIFSTLDWAQYKLYSMNVTSFTSLMPGKYGYKSLGVGSTETKIGQHTLTVNNAPLDEGVFPYATGPDAYSSSGSGSNGQWVHKTDLYKNNTSVLYSFRKWSDVNYVPRFKVFNNVNAGDEATVDFSEFVMMNTNQLSVEGSYSGFSTSVSVYPNTGDYSKSFSLYNMSTSNPEGIGNINLYYPSNLYSEYYTNIWFENDSESRAYTKIGALPSSIKKLNAQVNEFGWNGTDIQLSTSGNFDLLTAYYSTSTTVDEIFYGMSWYVYMPGGSHKVSVPQLPLQITENFKALDLFPDRKFDRVFIAEYDGFNGYTDYLKYLYQSNDLFAERNKESMTLYLSYENNSGGRKSKPEWKPIPELE